MSLPASPDLNSHDESMDSLTSGSDHDTNTRESTSGVRVVQAQGPSQRSNGAGKLCTAPARSLVPVIQSQPRTRNNASAGSGKIYKLAIPSGFPVHSSDVIPLACHGYDVCVREIASRLGFHERVVQEVYKQVSDLEQMEGVLLAMQKAAQRCGEDKIAKLVADDSDLGDSG